MGISEALAILKTHLSLEPVRCTSLVGIHLTSEDPKEAAEITQAVARRIREVSSKPQRIRRFRRSD
jgi:capsular polysaccharide biosynthesis protein